MPWYTEGWSPLRCHLLCCYVIFPFAMCSNSTPFVANSTRRHNEQKPWNTYTVLSISMCCDLNPESVSRQQSKRLSIHPNYWCTYQYHINHNLLLFSLILIAEAIALTSGQFTRLEYCLGEWNNALSCSLTSYYSISCQIKVYNIPTVINLVF